MMTVNTDRTICPHNPPYGRCGRYFATLIEDIVFLTAASSPTKALQSSLNAFVAEERALENLGA
jgi:hypothetical protein